MKNIICAIVVGLFPYVPVILLMGSIDLEVTLLGTAVAFLVALAVCILNMVLALKNKESVKKQVFLAMLVKLIHIPAYIFFFMIGVGGAMLVQFLAVTILIFLFDCVTIALSGTLELTAVLRAKNEGVLKTGEALVCSVFSFVFCIDVIVAIGVYLCVRKRADNTAE
ncbi:MAG: hypothetical protein IJO83_04835 [Clostridia bacterium]|nr:hypothetical protein [Clostridia bacterium]